MGVNPNDIVKIQANIAKLEEELAAKQAKIDDHKKELAKIGKEFAREIGLDVGTTAKKAGKSGGGVSISADARDDCLKKILANGKKLTEEELRVAYTKACGGKLRSIDSNKILKLVGGKYKLA